MNWKYRKLLSVAILAHFLLSGIAMAANLAPSQLQSAILAACSPYLKTLNLELGLVPVELTHNFLALEGPFRFQVQYEGDSENRWKDLTLILTNSSDSARLQRLGREVASLQIEARDNEVASVLSRLVRTAHQINPEKIIVRVRLQREVIFNRSDFNSADYRALSADDKLVKLFQAKVIAIDGDVSLVPELEDRRASKSLLSNELESKSN